MFHILVVDDDKNTRMYFQAVLMNNGYTVSVAKNGEDALGVLDKEHVDLVVLDIMMPRMNGYEFTKALRECDNNLPVMMVSAKQLPVDKNRGFEVGTDDYMTKPIDLDELFLRIGAILRRSKIASSHRLEVGNFVMDIDERSATLNGEEISLTAREFDLLYKLLSYPKKTFTRTQLMDEFWDVDTQTSIRTVDVYMTKLRAKLSECSSFEIQTVHGLGYKAVIK